MLAAALYYLPTVMETWASLSCTMSQFFLCCCIFSRSYSETNPHQFNSDNQPAVTFHSRDSSGSLGSRWSESDVFIQDAEREQHCTQAVDRAAREPAHLPGAKALPQRHGAAFPQEAQALQMNWNPQCLRLRLSHATSINSFILTALLISEWILHDRVKHSQLL